ncbi:MAG: hypothetical protein QNJ68_07495 [Microcoleaceae cyanobacterium MO_207.B10]|nr:hypothetical protein [Microcoleaceae cyanobacterium MO_207.B10]
MISVIILNALFSGIRINQDSSLIQQVNFKSQQKIRSELTAKKEAEEVEEPEEPEKVTPEPGDGRRDKANKVERNNTYSVNEFV